MRNVCHIVLTLCLLIASVVGVAHMPTTANAMPSGHYVMSASSMDQMMAECEDCTSPGQIDASCDVICAVPFMVARNDLIENTLTETRLHILPVANRADGMTRSPELSPPRLLS
ncbi:MAG: hypothetical protein ACMZ66_18420 [Thalassospira sp.]|uniref:hypothetical protein n=1 Tax=Thalassospira sp. TaxID=1912094 RepID=UPI003A857A3E